MDIWIPTESCLLLVPCPKLEKPDLPSVLLMGAVGREKESREARNGWGAISFQMKNNDNDISLSK